MSEPQAKLKVDGANEHKSPAKQLIVSLDIGTTYVYASGIVNEIGTLTQSTGILVFPGSSITSTVGASAKSNPALIVPGRTPIA